MFLKTCYKSLIYVFSDKETKFILFLYKLPVLVVLLTGCHKWRKCANHFGGLDLSDCTECITPQGYSYILCYGEFHDHKNISHYITHTHTHTHTHAREKNVIVINTGSATKSSKC